jgi:hypothetical protein
MVSDPPPRYTARIAREVEIAPGRWSVIDVEVVRTEDDQPVGEYRRNYPELFRTFEPFRVGAQELALYSPDYTGTRVLSLPDCTDLGGEERDGGGFCPVEFYVPQDETGEPRCGFAFVAGCVWGDDSSWKVEVIDLADIANGTVARDDRLGYVELPGKMPLRDAVRVFREPFLFEADDSDRPEWTLELAVAQRYRLDNGKPVQYDPFR